MSLSDHTQPVSHDPVAAAGSPSSSAPASTVETTSPPEPALDSTPATVAVPEAVEIVPRGILFSLAAIPLGMAASVLIWKLGFVASITSFLIAGVAGWLYVRGAGAPPRRGWLQLLAVILVGVAASFFAIVAADLVEVYNSPVGQTTGYPSAVDFVADNLFYGPVLKSYGTDLVMFVVFAALGVFGTVRRLLGIRKAV